MLNLEEAIEHYEKKAEELEQSAKLHQRPDKNIKGSGKRYLSCLECTEEYRQLVEWLKELKVYKDDCDCDYKTLKIKLENAEDIIRGLQEDLREAREEMRWR